MKTMENSLSIHNLTIHHLTRLVLSKGSGEEGNVGMYGELAAGPEGGVLTTPLTNEKDA